MHCSSNITPTTRRWFIAPGRRSICRDANWLAEQGWEVLAVEPSKLRELGKERTHPCIT